MQVREATPEDAERIDTVADASWHAAYGGFLPADVIDAALREWYDVEALRAQVGRGVFLVAEATAAEAKRPDAARSLDGGRDAGRVVGFAHADGTDDDGPAALGRLYVHPDWWGEGVGTALLRAVARRLREAGHDRLEAVVFAENDVGLSFYRSRGFEERTRRTDNFGGERREEVVVHAPLAALCGTDE